MRQMLLSFAENNIRLTPDEFSFGRRYALRFQWIALLAHERITRTGPGGGWVDIDQIRRLPLWRGKSRRHIGTVVGRYLQPLTDLKLVEAKARWGGPYRLLVEPSGIEFDCPLSRVRRLLGILESDVRRLQGEFYEFTFRFCRAESLIFEGRLVPDATKGRRQQMSASQELRAIAGTTAFRPSLRIFAVLAAYLVLDRLGHFKAADYTLDQHRYLLRRVTDPWVMARFQSASSWRHYRRGRKKQAQQEIDLAYGLAAETIDKLLLGSLADREGTHLSSAAKYEEALPKMLEGLEARLFTGNHDAVQASCFSIGNTLHRMGEQYYPDAQKWLELCVNICRWMHLGRDEALAEIILAKIALEKRSLKRCRVWLGRAETIVQKSRNRLNLIHYNIVWAFYFQRLSKPHRVRERLKQVWDTGSKLAGFDFNTIDRYLGRKFPDAWQEISGTVEP